MAIIKNYKYIIFIVFSLSLFTSCSSLNNSIYKNDFPLTSIKTNSIDSSFSVLIPKGWFSSLDNDCQCSEIFLVRNDLKASLSFVPVNYETKSEFDLIRNNLVNYSKIMKEAELKDKLIEIGKPEFFNAGNIQCAAYKYYNNISLPVRTVLFKFNNHYLELNAYITEKGLNGRLIPVDLYNVQNTIIESLQNN